jgi:hypothetical protein
MITEIYLQNPWEPCAECQDVTEDSVTCPLTQNGALSVHTNPLGFDRNSFCCSAGFVLGLLCLLSRLTHKVATLGNWSANTWRVVLIYCWYTSFAFAAVWNWLYLEIRGSKLISEIELRGIRWTGHVTRMELREISVKLLLGNLKRPHGRPMHIWANNIKMDLRWMRSEGSDWIHLAQRNGCLVARSCEHGTETQGFTKRGEFSWLAKWVLASQEGRSCKQLVS